jgi:hypothetical protein
LKLIKADVMQTKEIVAVSNCHRAAIIGADVALFFMGVWAMSVKANVKAAAPWLVPIYSYFLWNFRFRPRWRKAGMAAVFTEHFAKKFWACKESVSGYGSTIAATATIREILPKIVNDFGVQTILDIPCGDFNWMRLINLPVRYIGADIVDDLVSENQSRYGSDTRSFVRLDLTADPLPIADLVLCRDCLFHLSFADIARSLNNIRRSGSRYLLATTNPNVPKNKDAVSGDWRSIDLQKAPIFLPQPDLLIAEGSYSLPHAEDKYLGLWRVSSL